MPDLIFSIGEKKFADIFYLIAREKLKKLMKDYPILFTYRDAKYDFFRQSLRSLPVGILKEFVVKHKEMLKEMDKDGQPYLFVLLERYYERQINVIEKFAITDPEFFKLKTIDGLTLKDLMCDIREEKNLYKKMAKKLKQ